MREERGRQKEELEDERGGEREREWADEREERGRQIEKWEDERERERENTIRKGVEPHKVSLGVVQRRKQVFFSLVFLQSLYLIFHVLVKRKKKKRRSPPVVRVPQRHTAPCWSGRELFIK